MRTRLLSVNAVAVLALWVLTASSACWAQTPPPPQGTAPAGPILAQHTASGESADPARGIRFGLGFPFLEVTSDSLNQDVAGGKFGDTGLMLNLEVLLGSFQVGYVRQIYRKSLDADVTFNASGVDTLAFDADQVWGFHVFRAGGSLTLGYGLGLQRRAVRLLLNDVAIFEKAESGALAGLMAEWAFAPPFSLNLRLFQDLSGDILRQRGVSLQLNYGAGF